MRLIGILLVITGTIWAICTFNMKTTVKNGGEMVGSGIYSTYIPKQEIHNLELADKRRNHLLGAGVLFLSGTLLFGLESSQSRKGSPSNHSGSNQDRTCPFCAEAIKAEAKICRFCSKELEPVKVNNREVCLKCKYFKRTAFQGTICNIKNKKVKEDYRCEEWAFYC
jgi:hypothetical protein